MDSSNELANLTRRLELTEVSARQNADRLNRAAFELAFPEMLEGKTYGEAAGGLTILNQPEDQFRAELKSIDNDLSRQIAIVNEALDQWFTKGEIPAPYYPWRIAVILSKSKRKGEEAAFLTAWCKHFGQIQGTRYAMLARRAIKLKDWRRDLNPMNARNFLEQFGYTNRRSYLIGLLMDELAIIHAKGWGYRALVFGSLVNSGKSKPSDIDVLLCVTKPLDVDRWRAATVSEDIEIFPCQLSSTFSCYDADEMVRRFNEGTRRTGEEVTIFSEECIEVTL